MNEGEKQFLPQSGDIPTGIRLRLLQYDIMMPLNALRGYVAYLHRIDIRQIRPLPEPFRGLLGELSEAEWVLHDTLLEYTNPTDEMLPEQVRERLRILCHLMRPALDSAREATRSLRQVTVDVAGLPPDFRATLDWMSKAERDIHSILVRLEESVMVSEVSTEDTLYDVFEAVVGSSKKRQNNPEHR